ncbi:hypothetical protein [Ferrimonas balearica]|uniref:hypothetical protein n=1 Tax=Ferrimonas balearica TaxID=44012 RepID=UPI001C576605|nr:hypothetical protein [Ferrimonas balearica]MBW3140539.1 hypothetical protein [Ferrimonas balearica]MBW3165467.1 hypothetical protein [Ferrimonas balearica]MBY5981319.1 hypothetical protein [Ferrimonas balearica]MBY6226635.1 hypothetical protein [Ferrimonas balearica]
MQHRSLFRELLGPCLLLAATLLTLHHSPRMVQALAGQAVNAGCHQGGHQGHHMAEGQS